MRRLDDDDPDVVVPPAGLVDYGRWCADRGVSAYGRADDATSMEAAVDQWDAWMQLRREWAAAHGFVEDDDMDLVGDQPWDGLSRL